MTPPPEQIIWCYSERQPAYDKLSEVQFCQGLPDEDMQKENVPKLVVLDDLMAEFRKGPKLIELFTRGCYHWSCSIIHITQDIFFDKQRTSRINGQYVVLRKNPADRLTPQNLARQMFPEKVEGFMQAYDHATK